MQGAKKESVIVSKLYSCICSFSNKIESVKGRKAEYIVLILYVICHIVITCFHEPWYDEAEAWNIAKSGSLKEIILDVPHLEGHPALWYIILKLFIAVGIAYELALNICSLIFSGMAVYLLLFKSPFPRAVRISLPFSYFVFYQYGVICRPYCVTMMAFMVAALVYKDRNIKPLRYTLSLALICATSAYGLVLSGGMAIAWVIELLKNNKIKSLFMNKSVYCLLGLLIYALFILYRIIPEDGNVLSGGTDNEINGVAIRLIYSFLVIIPDLLFTNIFNEYGHLHSMPFEYISFSVAALLGLVILIVFIKYGAKKKTVLSLIIPFTLFSLFSGLVYLFNHHIGILLCFLVFWFWISYEKPTLIINEESNLKRYITVIGITGCLIVSIIWSLISSTLEILDNYGPASEMADYLEDNKLTDSSVLFSWNGDIYGVKYSPLEVAFLPYKTDEVILNWPVERELFPLYLAPESPDFCEELVQIIRNISAPKVIIGEVNFAALYNNRLLSGDYNCVHKIEHSIIWKGTKYGGFTNIYIYKNK